MNRKISERVSKSLIGKIGEKSRRWKGDDASYSAKHMWIKKHYGNASTCEICGTTECKRYEWANISGEYKRDISDYMQLCPSCHRKKDLNKTHCPKGHEYNEENTYYSKQGWKNCKICRKESRERWKNKEQ